MPIASGCINRNILECKVKLQQASSKQKAVLIETYWNVKTEEVTETPEPEAVLIETYWNVKLYDSGIIRVTTSY